MKPCFGPFDRYDRNPILTQRDLPYEANAVFNPGAAIVGEETLLLMRVEDRRGLSHLTAARSKNGLDGWRVDPSPTLAPDPGHPEEEWGTEDPRITFLDELKAWAVTYTAYSPQGPQVSLALTRDFSSFERKGPILPPEDKDAALFPRRFNGRWAILHRPTGRPDRPGGHIWISFSQDLESWTDTQIVMKAREGAWWDASKIGLCAPPLETQEGWLITYHGVKTNCAGSIYRVGLALLALDDPTRVLLRSSHWAMGPVELYERTGDVDNVVFPCGWVEKAGAVKMYYGAADTRIGVAQARVSDLLAWLKDHSEG